MSIPGRLALALALSAGSTATPAAHHSFAAEFDGSKLLVLTGVLTKFEWENPHGWLYVDVKDDKGMVTSWALETASPNVLRRADDQMRDRFIQNVGKAVSVTACPAKNGTARGAAEDVKFADGHIAAMGSRRYTGDLNSEEILGKLK